MIMKKVFNSLFVIIAAMVTFAGCAKQEVDAPATPETKTVQFFANSIETKTAFGTPVVVDEVNTYPTLWSAGDKVSVTLNFGTKKESSEVECLEESTKAHFVVNDLPVPAEGPYTFYSISPSDNLRGVSSTHKRLYVEIPNEQTPLETSVDMKAQLLYAASETAEVMPESVEFNYQHLTAYGKFSLANLTDKVTSVLSIKIEAPEGEFIAGKWDYFVDNASFEIRSGEGKESITLDTQNTTDIWFACAPIDVSNKTMTLTVSTDKGDLVKKLIFPENRKFEAGRIAKFIVDMAGIEVEGTDEPEQPGETTAYYEKVTSAPTDWSGKYLLVNETAAMTLSAISTTSTKYGVGKEVTITDGKIAATDELTACQVEIAKATSTTDAYVMKFGGKYLTWKSGNSLNVTDSESTNTYWNITLSDSNSMISNCSDPARIIYWNPSSPRFACYAKSGQDMVQLYVLVESSDEGGETPEPEEPKILESIAVSGQTTTYTVGDLFEFDGVVTATYDDNTTATVTPTSVSVPDLETSGTKTITVTYTEGNITVETTYTITVNEAPAGPIVATVEQFLAAENSTAVWYQLTGTISNIQNTTYGNFDLIDATGTVYVYGLKASEDANKTSFETLGLKAGDIVTLIGNRDNYNGKDEVVNAYYVSHVAAPTLEVSPANITVEADVTTAEFELSCDTCYDITYPEGVVEVSEVHSKETGSSTYTVEFPANETTEPIKYVITVKADAEGFDVEKTVTITQKAASLGGGDEPVVAPSGTVLWAETWADAGANSTSFASNAIISTYDYAGRTGYEDNATSVTYTADASNNVRITKSSGGNCTSGHLWFNKSVAGELKTSAIKLYGATSLTFSHSQGTSGSSCQTLYSVDGGSNWTSLGSQSGATAKKTYTFTVPVGTESIMIKLAHASSNAKNTRVDNLELKVN